jgi:hypothetical protein
MILAPVLSNKTLLSYPKNPVGGRVPYMPLDVAFTSRFKTDAHFAGYYLPTVERRLCVELVRDPSHASLIPDGVTMTLAIFDVDCPNHAPAGTPEADDWWVAEKAKIAKLRRVHRQGFAYRTRGGYRIVYILGSLVTLRTERDDVLWSTTYLTWVAYLCRRFDIVADRSCADWTRLFRLPHATRDTKPEEMDSVGDPTAIGAWDPPTTYADAVVATTLSRRTVRRAKTPSFVHAGDGVLFYAFRARGWMGGVLSEGKWAVVCPWESQHSKGGRFDSSTVLYAPGHGERLGWFHCSHQHCQGRGIREVLRLFSDYELSDAKRACGVAA